MGQKVNPVSYRLQVNKNWSSKWFSRKVDFKNWLIEDIKIREIGLRPGEKLYEEMLIKTENLDKTDNNLIFVERDRPFTRAEIQSKLNLLDRAVQETTGEINAVEIKEAMRKVVPTFRDPEEINRHAAEAEEMKLCEH